MKLFTAEQIKQLDAYTIEHEPISSIDLMERASDKIYKVFKKHFKRDVQVAVVAGPGNNGGDGLALARMLVNDDYNVEVYITSDPKKLSPDGKINYDRLTSIGVQTQVIKEKDLPDLRDKIVIDAIFGSGLSRPAEGVYAKIIEYINNCSCTVFSIDIPSGLFCESNSDNIHTNIVRADYTVSLQFPKLAFLFANNQPYCGKVVIEDIGLLPDGIAKIDTPYRLISKEKVCSLLMPRDKFSHKGTYGHALLVAGSYCKMGAAVLSSKACLRSGVGLLTSHVPHIGYNILQTAIPEAMCCIDRSEFHTTEVPDLTPFNAIGVGPGLGTKTNTVSMFAELLEKCKVPMVIDADGLNILASKPELLKQLPAGSILTPHPGEFNRLFGSEDDGFDQLQKQLKLSAEYNIYIVLKGAHTAITSPSGEAWFNTTGNPGMSTAGSGDVLTGIILSFLAQGYAPLDAALCAVWLHGHAADIYATNGGFESLTATDIIENLGKAFADCRPEFGKAYYF